MRLALHADPVSVAALARGEPMSTSWLMMLRHLLGEPPLASPALRGMVHYVVVPVDALPVEGEPRRLGGALTAMPIENRTPTLADLGLSKFAQQPRAPRRKHDER